ncbi:MAG: hypothetical protein ACRYFV_09295 [Janthinobacterium lividum]
MQPLCGRGKQVEGGGKAGLTQHLLGYEQTDGIIIDQIEKYPILKSVTGGLTHYFSKGGRLAPRMPCHF